MNRHRTRTAVLVLGVLVLLPAGAAHASLPIDPAATKSASTAAQSTSDDDDAVADEDDDQGSDGGDEADDESLDADDSDSSASDDDLATDQGAADDDPSTVASGTRSGPSASPSPKHRSAPARVKAPRGVRARLAAFDRVVVSWKPGSSVRLTRWVVTLRSGGSGRLLYLGRLARSATFTALKPGVRYTATVTATASGGRAASASARIRTPSLRRAVRAVAREQARLERAARLAKVQRFG